jgi:hypothetical protein
MTVDLLEVFRSERKQQAGQCLISAKFYSTAPWARFCSGFTTYWNSGDLCGKSVACPFSLQPVEGKTKVRGVRVDNYTLHR